MNRISQHVPTFVEMGDEPRKFADFSTLDELLTVPFVARWKDHPHFLRYSKSDECLMVEYSPYDREPAGAHWVIGFLRQPDLVDLPEWVETEAQRLRREAWNRGEPGVSETP